MCRHASRRKCFAPGIMAPMGAKRRHAHRGRDQPNAWSVYASAAPSAPARDRNRRSRRSMVRPLIAATARSRAATVGNAKVQQRVQTMDFAAISTFVSKNPAGIMSFLGGGVIAWGLGLLWTHMIVRPVISVRLDDKRGCSGTMPIFTNIDGKQERYDAKFIRLQVENTGLSTIKDCCGYITKLTKRTDTGNVIQQEAVFPLGWAYHPHSDARNIPPGVFFYMDVVQLHLFQTGERELRPPYPPDLTCRILSRQGHVQG